MKHSPPWRAKIELALCKLGLLVIPPLPRRVVVALAHAIAAVAWRVARRERRIGMANLDLAYDDTLTPQAKRAILCESFHTFALMMLDVFWFSKQTAARVARWVDFDPSMEPLWHHRATVGVTAHMGNWELLGQSVSLRGYPLASVAMPLANPAVDELFQKIRTDNGQQIIPRQGAVRHLLRSLRTGHKIALLLDQNTLPSEGGQFVDFFGVPVPVSAAGSVLGLKTGAVFFFGFCLPQPGGRYRMVATGAFTPDPIPPNGDEAAVVAALTQRTAAMIERAVRAYPGQWLWTYKRWKFIPPGADPARYPYYAKPLPDASKA
jgi:KDO2-lipid IV(A) lauroyltransferase